MAPEHENALDDLDMMFGEDPQTSSHNDLPEAEFDWSPFYLVIEPMLLSI